MKQKYKPKNIALDLKQKELRLDWQDGYESQLSLELLRQHCPCAVCEEARKQAKADPLFVFNASMAGMTSELDVDNPVQKVGQYALQFIWADGHRSGIYSYAFLRELSEQTR